jgi:hypothetical protein
MNDENLEAFSINKALLVCAKTVIQFGRLFRVELLVRFGGHQGQEGDDPEGKFFIFNLEGEQFEEIAFDDVKIC